MAVSQFQFPCFYRERLESKVVSSVRYGGLMTNRVGKHRQALRHEILNSFPGIYLNSVAAAVKSPGQSRIRFADLESFCESAGVPVSALPDIFSSYHVNVNRMSEAKFIEFLRDEVTCTRIEPRLNPSLTNVQIAALTQFVAIIKSRKTQNYVSNAGKSEIGRGLSGKRYQLSSTWSLLLKMNPQQSGEQYIRIATLCRVAAELGLGLSTEEFIDALFAFYNRRIDQITFDEFAQLVEAFA
jgi:hypothetical protein